MFLNPGLFWVEVSLTDSRGCVNSDSTFIEIFADPVISIPNDTTICRGDSIRLFSTDIETVVWSPNYAIDDTLSLTPLVYPDTTTTYVVFGVDSNGCSSQLGGFVQVTVDRVIMILVLVRHALEVQSALRTKVLVGWGPLYNGIGTLEILLQESITQVLSKTLNIVMP